MPTSSHGVLMIYICSKLEIALRTASWLQIAFYFACVACYRRPPLKSCNLMDLWLRNCRGSFEKIEVAPLVGLLDVFEKQFAIAARIDSGLRPPSGAAPTQLLFADAHI